MENVSIQFITSGDPGQSTDGLDQITNRDILIFGIHQPKTCRMP
jgi:hypothetical protein